MFYLHKFNYLCLFVCVMVFNAAILWRSDLLMEETAGPRENHQPVTIHWQTLSQSGFIHFFVEQNQGFSRTFQDKNYSFQAPFSEHFHI
jgi:hypothetical protein